MRTLFALLLSFAMMHLDAAVESSPPGGGPPWYDHKTDLADTWEELTPPQQRDALATEYSQSAPGDWLTSSADDQQRIIFTEQAVMNELTPDGRRTFMNLPVDQRKQILYRYQYNQEDPNALLKAYGYGR